MDNLIAVTGATGAIGGAVARILAADGIALRLPVRDLSRAPALPGATAAECSYADRSAAETALEGIHTLFMVSAGESKDRVEQHLTFVDAAREAGVQHIVYTSFFGAAADATFTLGRDHWATEEYIRRSGIAYTFLRNNLYLDVLQHFADDDGTIRGPAGNGRLAAVSREDVVQVSTAILRDAAVHAGNTYELTGPTALTLAEAAAIISKETGREVTYRNETVDEAYASRQHFGAPDWQLDAWVSTYTAIAEGGLARTTTTVQDLTGRPAQDLAQVLRDDR
ncbi:SDR family oxidoreductase [Arthrobacter flavus]|uniref:SDR family oxidoreductase n=1 Tax=Arthrobacter flavus TaxID=95172 RepID=A0ABW4Q3X3_9MICC